MLTSTAEKTNLATAAGSIWYFASLSTANPSPGSPVALYRMHTHTHTPVRAQRGYRTSVVTSVAKRSWLHTSLQPGITALKFSTW